ncbi:MAG: hypothetical protein IPI18_17555 [Saprospiraceae bacterium]|nr:hypothetical protein [Saprospiraceae bacterium]
MIKTVMPDRVAQQVPIPWSVVKRIRQWMRVNMLASLGDYVWYDKNKVGIQDNIIDPNGNIVGPEMPVKGISVQLKRVSDNSVGVRL